jgi:hypothetical protein
MRKLASIQTIKDIQPIEGADAIQRARVLGWNVVVKLDEFKPGDKCVYVEIDSLLPEKPEFEFMRQRKFRVQTIKLRGQISQGICFPVTILPKNMQGCPEGTDVTDVIGIKKWEPYQKPQKGQPKLAGVFRKKSGMPFPSFIYKTDETRVQILEKLLEKYRGHRFYRAEKMDGSSFTAYLKDGKFGIASRNLELARPGDDWWSKVCTKFNLRKKIKMAEYKWTIFMDKYNPKWTGIVRKKFFNELLALVDIDAGVDPTFWELALELDLETKMRSLCTPFGTNLVIQGEMCGPGIQGNKYDFKKKDLFVFQAFDPDSLTYYSLEETEKLVRALGLNMVPIIDRDFVLNHTVDELVAMAEGKSVHNKKTEREGDVYRLVEPKFDFDLGDLNAGFVSFKVISPKFNLKYDE